MELCRGERSAGRGRAGVEGENESQAQPRQDEVRVWRVDWNVHVNVHDADQEIDLRKERERARKSLDAATNLFFF